MKKFLTIFLIIFLGLGVFLAENCLALSPPQIQGSGICMDCGKSKAEECKGPYSVKVCWTLGGGTGVLKQFKILYRKEGSETWTPKYPGAAEISFTITGLTPNTNYEWRIKAEAQNPANDSAFVVDKTFSTTQEDVPPENENGNENENGYIPSPTQQLINPLLVDTLCELFNKLINFLFILALGIAPIVVIVAGVYMLSGEPEKVKRAKEILLWAAIALTIIFLAKGLPSIIKGALGG